MHQARSIDVLTTEKQLLDAIKSGERSAERRLYNHFIGYATAVGMRYIADENTLKDVLQDSFIKIFTQIKKFEYRGEGSLKAWIGRIVANNAIDNVKQNAHFISVDEVPEMTDDDASDIEKIPQDVLTKLISELPDGYRLVLNLFVFGQKSHKEIARLLGIKENSSASQYARAKQLLSKKIRDYMKRHDEGRL